MFHLLQELAPSRDARWAAFWLLFAVAVLAVAWRGFVRLTAFYGSPERQRVACWLLLPFWRRRDPPPIVIDRLQQRRGEAQDGGEEYLVGLPDREQPALRTKPRDRARDAENQQQRADQRSRPVSSR
jgi:hypothetical protein